MSSFDEIIESLQSKNVDSEIINALSILKKGNDSKETRIRSLENEIEDIKKRVLEVERYNSKDSLIVVNPPINSAENISGQVLQFLNEHLRTNIRPADLVACPPLGRYVNANNPPAVIITFIYFAATHLLWARKAFL